MLGGGLGEGGRGSGMVKKDWGKSREGKAEDEEE